jgi:hypothetical protein
MNQAKAIIAALHAVARPLILRHYASDSCIGSTAIALAALRAFGVTAHPIAGRLLVCNPPMVRHIQRGEPSPDSSPAQLAKCQQDGCWQVAVGFGADGKRQALPGKWAGHLWLLADDQECAWMIDLSLDQANRPQRQIALESLAAPLTTELISPFIDGQQHLALELNGCMLVYKAEPSNTG